MKVAAILLAVVPVGVVLWLIRRRSKPRANIEQSVDSALPFVVNRFEAAPIPMISVPSAAGAISTDAPPVVVVPEPPIGEFLTIAPDEPAVRDAPANLDSGGGHEVKELRGVGTAPDAEGEPIGPDDHNAVNIPREASENFGGTQPAFPEARFAQASEMDERNASKPALLEVQPACLPDEASSAPEFSADGAILAGGGQQPDPVEDYGSYGTSDEKKGEALTVTVAGPEHHEEHSLNDRTVAGVEPLVAEAPAPAEPAIPYTEPLAEIEADPEESAFEPAETNDVAAAVRPIPLYRPVARRPPLPRKIGAGRAANQDRAPANTVSFDIRVRVMMNRTGIRDITFLPARGSDVTDSEVAVKFENRELLLVAEEDWYQDLQFADADKHLSRGIELLGLLADGRRARWLLSGRKLYILATHPHTSGYLSTNRLMLGRPHVVLCADEFLEPVEQMLRMAGCAGYSRLGNDDGVPPGWIALRDVNPVQAILSDLGDVLLDAVKPAPDIEIALEGGICLRNQDWLAGYPPAIKLYRGAGAMQVFIDGKEAESRDDGFVVEGYDQPGAHTVHCAPHTRTYSIVEPLEEWDEWPAYDFREANICGPLVRPKSAGENAITVPMTNPVLIGAEPGQVFRCSSRNVAHWKGYVPFAAVWALPAQPLICNKKTSRILQLGTTAVPPASVNSKGGLWWSNVILDASRKGLRLENETPETRLLWNEYRKIARAIWRAAR